MCGPFAGPLTESFAFVAYSDEMIEYVDAVPTVNTNVEDLSGIYQQLRFWISLCGILPTGFDFTAFFLPFCLWRFLCQLSSTSRSRRKPQAQFQDSYYAAFLQQLNSSDLN